MHVSIARLLDYVQRKTADSDSPVLDDGGLRRVMGVSPAVMPNWKSRGISKEGALAAEAMFGCSANWVMTGNAGGTLTFPLLSPEQVKRLNEKHIGILEKLALVLLSEPDNHPSPTQQPVDKTKPKRRA